MEESLLLAQLKDPASRNRAFEQVVKLYQQVLYWHIRKMIPDHEQTDDVLQLTFIKAWKNLDKFRGDAKLKTWLYRIATNEALTHLRKEKKRQLTPVEDIQNLQSYSETHGGFMAGDEIAAKLQRAVAQLPEKQKLVFNMKYFDDLKYDEIAAILGGSIGSLKASFHHAVKKIELFLHAD